MKTLVRTNGSLLSGLSTLDDYLFRNWANWSNDNWRPENSTLPAVNINEADDSYIIELAAPGMKRDDFKVEMQKNTLKISSQREKKNEANDGAYSRREFSYHAFERSFTLPEDVEPEKINARYEAGILEITIPKKDLSKLNPTRQISVK